jgi:hypothetical protein
LGGGERRRGARFKEAVTSYFFMLKGKKERQEGWNKDRKKEGKKERSKENRKERKKLKEQKGRLYYVPTPPISGFDVVRVDVNGSGT